MILSARMGLVISMLLAASAAAAPRSSASLIAKVDDFVRTEMQREKVPGVAIGIVSQGQVLGAKGYGYANIENRVPVTHETIFQSGSVGKQFTAVAVMLQVEDGALALDDSITKHFTNAPQSWRPIRIRHLLTHTSGIPDYTDDIDLRHDFTEDELTKAAYRLPLEFEPGSRWRYSNTGYILLGILIHRVSGRFYGDVLKDRVFTPLGMKTARVISEEDIVANRAAGYRLVNGELKNQEWVSPVLNTTADGALYLTMLDLIAWDRGLRKRAILKPQNWSQVFTPVTLKSGKSYPHGFGWFIDEVAGQPLHQHSGEWQGFSAHISRYLGDDLTVIVLANSAAADASRFADGIAAIFDAKLAKREPAPIPDTEPAITERVLALLRKASEGKLSPENLPYERQGFFPDGAKQYEDLLRPLGTPQRLDLLERRELGDDRVYSYLAVYRDRTLAVQFALAPDNRVSAFEIQPK